MACELLAMARGLSFPDRGGTPAPCIRSALLATGPLRKPPVAAFTIHVTVRHLRLRPPVEKSVDRSVQHRLFKKHFLGICHGPGCA